MDMPSAIIFVNADMNNVVRTTLMTQLEINELMTFTEFNARVSIDPNYPFNVHANKLRILVVVPDFHDTTNRTLADIALFVSHGLASVEKNNFGPPGLTLPTQRLNIWNLINGIKGSSNSCQPFPHPLAPPETQTPWNPKPHEHLKPHHPEGLGALELFGVEALEEDGIDEGVFGDQLQPNRKDNDDH